MYLSSSLMCNKIFSQTHTFVLLKCGEGLEYRLSSFFVSDEHLLKVGLFFAGPPNFQY